MRSLNIQAIEELTKFLLDFQNLQQKETDEPI